MAHFKYRWCADLANLRLTGCPQVLHVYWYYLMIMIAVDKLTVGELKDTREQREQREQREARYGSSIMASSWHRTLN